MGFIAWLFNALYGAQSTDINALAQTMYDAFQYEDQRITDDYNTTASSEAIIENTMYSDVQMIFSVIRVISIALTAIVVVNIANLRQYVDNRVDNLGSFLSSKLDWFIRGINLLIWGLRLLIDGVKQWVEVAVAGPLWGALNAFIRKVTGELFTLFQYILHPELLVKLLAGYLWSAWLQLLHIFAVPIVRYLMRAMFVLKDEFVGILIDVLSEII